MENTTNKSLLDLAKEYLCEMESAAINLRVSMYRENETFTEREMKVAALMTRIDRIRFIIEDAEK